MSVQMAYIVPTILFFRQIINTVSLRITFNCICIWIYITSFWLILSLSFRLSSILSQTLCCGVNSNSNLSQFWILLRCFSFILSIFMFRFTLGRFRSCGPSFISDHDEKEETSSDLKLFQIFTIWFNKYSFLSFVNFWDLRVFISPLTTSSRF
jgi:hypothetical protein